MPLINKTRTHNVVPGRELVGLRVAITAFFALDGFIFSGWVVRIPDIKHQTHASAGALGLALLGVSAGAVLTMMLTGRLCRRYGSHPVTVVWMVVLALSVALPPLTHSAPALGAVLLIFGAAYGGLNVRKTLTYPRGRQHTSDRTRGRTQASRLATARSWA